MTELNFKGKEFVYNHHLAVPHRPLVANDAKSIGKPDLSGNLIIQGDNLHALKSLLPLYAGEVDCIFIDPPYNTGEEGWSYNDNVNAPMIKEWLANNPVGVEDGLRHDKWCAMMWPRLKLLHELLADKGSFWMTLDDNEVHRGKLLLDEIFNPESFIGEICWNSRRSKQNDAKISTSHNYILVYLKNSNSSIGVLEEDEDSFSNPDNDPRGPWKADPFDAPNIRENLTYEIVNPNTGKIYLPPKGRCWRTTKGQYEKYLADGRIVFGKKNTAKPQLKRYFSNANEKGKVPDTWWDDVGTTTNATQELQKIFSGVSPFSTPKPVGLLKKIIDLSLPDNALILDSFAGSGTTAHAVLQANKLDGGNRRFILVEMEDHIVNDITAERVRRVINGYSFTGIQKTELYKEKLTYSKFKKEEFIPSQVLEMIVEQHGSQFDRIVGEVKDNTLVMNGVNNVKEKTEGLGGSFTYCTLGEPIDLDRILTGETLPAYQDLAPILYHMATNQTLDPANIRSNDGYVGATESEHIWMIYKPDLEWLKSDAAALTLSKAKEIQNTDKNKQHLVFAPARFVSEKVIKDEGLKVSYVPFPAALYRMVRNNV